MTTARMRSLGLDIGDARSGVAISDPQGMLATPLAVLDSRDQDALIDAVLKLAAEHNVEHIVVGLPRRLSGELGRQADKVTAFADRLLLRAKQGSFDRLEMTLWDERLSTRAAERLKTQSSGKAQKLRSGGKKGARDRGFRAKAGVDAIAAAFILQGYLDSLREGEQWRDT